MALLRILLVLGLIVCPVVVNAAPVTFSGYLDDESSLSPAGGELVNEFLGPADLTWPQFNVALFTFDVATASAYTVTSLGYNDVYGNSAGVDGVDGFDAYVAIFAGTGSAAVYLEEFFNPLFPGDFQASTAVLAAGTYTLAVSMWNNFACGNGGCFPSTGTLGDGFSGLPQLDLGRALYFEVSLETSDNVPPPVPEPSALLLVLTGGLAAAGRARSVQKRGRH